MAAKPRHKTGSDKRVGYRAGAGMVALFCLGILAIAAYIKPDPSGVGSHTQLGFRACGFYQRMGYPCITCGMTTAFAHVVRGQFIRAFIVQPAGALGAMICAVTAVLAGYAFLTGRGQRAFAGLLNRLCVNWAAVLMIVVGVVLGSWGWTCVLTYLRVH